MSSLLSCNMSHQGLSPQLTADKSWAFLKQAILENLPVIRENLHGHVQLRRHIHCCRQSSGVSASSLAFGSSFAAMSNSSR